MTDTTSTNEYQLLRYIGGRKFVLAILIVILSSILVYLQKISDGVYSTIILADIAAYIAGNVYQYVNTVTKSADIQNLD